MSGKGVNGPPDTQDRSSSASAEHVVARHADRCLSFRFLKVTSPREPRASSDTIAQSAVRGSKRVLCRLLKRLYRSRYDLAHGVVNSNAESLAEAQHLRGQAKDIVKSFFAIAAWDGHVIPPSVDYHTAIRMPRPITPSKIRLQATTTARL